MRWTLKTIDIPATEHLAREISVPSSIAQLLVQRGITDPHAAHRFLHPALDHLHSPFGLLGMKTAVERLERAMAQKETVLIYGDYDVDGTTAVVILKTCIELLGGVTEFHVPHRIREGYGIKDEVIEQAAGRGIRLVISVDTGIRAFQAAETAKRLGLELIVTDHHLPELAHGVPDALAVINPNQQGCDYECKELCGAGVAFKIAQALLTRAGRERLVPSFLKMVAIATIADAVPLTGENRVFAKLGLEGLRRPVNGGLKALLQVAQLDGLQRGLTATDIAFRIAPRINAAGRMDVASEIVELFTTANEPRQKELALKLNQLNAERQAEEQRIVEAINQRLDSDAALRGSYCLLVDGDGWHRGVIGICATRVVERTGRPALVVSRDLETGEAHGSGRSIPAFHLLDALESPQCRPLFTRFGGHAFAVGFSLPNANIEPLRAALDRYARSRLAEADFQPEIRIDAELGLAEITPAFYRQLQMLEPFGVGNREPVFLARSVRLSQPPKVMKEIHIKLRLASEANGKTVSLDALGWRMAKEILAEDYAPGEKLDLAFTVDENLHPDFGGLQLIVRALRRAGA
ncbi:MAG: single-stranded-DNA-specific exonuclease RecJ [Acidobacteriales bacterium]|nr:single-stranded-DNA-specific exonuclease RecJ [Terriglobales bacterium]